MRSRTPVFLLLGSFAVGFNVAVALHEVGHLVVSWLTRGDQLHAWTVLLHPFAESAVGQDDWSLLAPGTRLSVLAGGIAAGTLIPLLLLPFMRRLPPGTAPRLALLMTAAGAMMVNGLHLATALLVPWGDGAQMLDLGVPAWALAAVSAPLLVAWVVLLAAVVREAGLAESMTASRSLAQSVLGISMYPAVMIAFQALAGDPGGRLDPYVLFALTVALAMALAVPLARRIRRRTRYARPVRVTRQTAPSLLSAGAVLVALELWVGPFRLERPPPRTVVDLCPYLAPTLEPWVPSRLTGPEDLYGAAWETPPLDGLCRVRTEEPPGDGQWNVTVEVRRYTDETALLKAYVGYGDPEDQVSHAMAAIGDDRRLGRTDLLEDDSTVYHRQWMAVVRVDRSLLAIRADRYQPEVGDTLDSEGARLVVDLAGVVAPVLH